GYWRADEATERELVEAWQSIAQRHDVHTANETFVAHVEALAQGYGLDDARAPDPSHAPAHAQASSQAHADPRPQETPPPVEPVLDVPLEHVRGQELREVPQEPPVDTPVAW